VIGQGLKLSDLAQRVLDGVVEHWQGAADATPLPAHRAVLAGEPRAVAWDCEQLTVTLAGVGWGQALDASASSPRAGLPASVASMRHAVLAVALVRCTPSPGRDGKVALEALHAAGLASLRDAGLLSQALVEITTRLRKNLPLESSVQAGTVEPLGPSGGFHGLEATLVVTSADLE
jgi:hypothetical protein